MLAGVRWLRVAQREHYLPGSVTRFAFRWWRLGPNVLLKIAAILSWLLTLAGVTGAGVITAGAIAVGPFGLPVKGRTSKLAWTRRMKTLAAIAGVIAFVPMLLGPKVATAVALLTPLIVDLALVITKPIEQKLGQKFVDQAAARLTQVAPTVVAITGSYGKTSTKGYVAHLLGSTKVEA